MRLVKTLIVALFCATVATGQTNKGGISGTVFDPNGAVVPGATVTLTNAGNNHQIVVITSESGAYSFSSLDPVTYNILVEAAGFKKVLLEKVKVDTATTAAVNITLETGSITQQVYISSDAQLINTESGTPSQTITERQIVEMPLNNRSVLDLVLTTPGATGVAGTEDPELDVGDTTIPAPGFNVNINGGRAGSTAILADGASNTGVGLARAVVTFSPDTVQEFTVQRSNFSAEFGQTGGGVVNLTTKSGNNDFNGLFYWYHRNPTFNAAPYTTQTNNRPLSRRRQHQFGLTFSGPVPLPRFGEGGPSLKSGRDKTFFFVAFEPRYYYDESPFTSNLPTEAMRRGDFNDVVAIDGGFAPRTIVNQFGLQSQIRDATLYNHYTVVNGNQLRFLTNPNGTLVTAFTPFANNIIPANLIDPTSRNVMQFFPDAGEWFLADGQLRNYASSTFIKDLERRFTLRLDHHVTSNNQMSFRYTQVPIRGDRGRANFEVGKDEINSGGTDYSWSKQLLLTDTHTFGSAVVNELRLNYTFGRFSKTLPPGFDPQGGRNLSTELGLPSITVGGLPEFQTAPYSLGTSLSTQNENSEHNYEIADNVSWVHGDHVTKFGVFLLRQDLKTIPLFGSVGGRYEFARNTTLTNSNGQASGTGGIPFAQFLMGTYNQTTLRDTIIPYYYQWLSGALFLQDDWKVKPNLTLNMGVRYALQFPRTEKYDRQGAFLPELAQEFPLPAPITLADGRVITTALVPPFAFSGRGGRSRYAFPVEKRNFEPRFGFAWTPRLFGWNKDSKFVLRGGYGLSHAPLSGTGRNPSPDFSAGTVTYGTTDLRNQFVDLSGRNAQGAPINVLAARLGSNIPVLNPQSPEAFLNIPADGLVYLGSINFVNIATATSQAARVPYVQNWSLSAAYELPQNTVLELAYTGAKGTHLFLPPINTNQVPFELSEAYLAQGRNANVNINDPLGRRTPTGAVVQFPDIYQGTKYFGFSGLNEQFNASANSIYHAGSVSLNRRFAKGLTYTVNYTFSKSIDEASDAGDIRFVNLNVRSPGHINFGAPRSEDRAVSLFDVRHAFSTTFLYDLPFGKGQHFLSKPHWLVQGVLGNWSFSGVGRIQSGLPLVTVLRDDNGVGVPGNVRAIRPDIVPGVPLLNPRYSSSCPTGGNCEPYFNPAAFMRPIKGELGNAPRTLDGARAPWQQFLDVSLQKNFLLGKDGKRRLQFRVDAINVLNHPIFRNGRLEDSGEIFAAPNEALLTNNEYDAWRNFSPTTRPARGTQPATDIINAINGVSGVGGLIRNNRQPGTQCPLPGSTTNCALRLDFYHVRVPEGFFSMNANQFDIANLEGYQLYRMRQAYTPDRWGFLNVMPGRSGYSPRFIQFAVKLYF
ncbi:MAG TPA: carboxypeptidase regulatory-like domain-containing protein [Pyrinomonadaceae bacterium]|nr:carboxypeptidase regulatory-like domain-containing protein [Pyrinomonadaceae bacterium]